MNNRVVSVDTKSVKLYDGFENELYNQAFVVQVAGYGGITVVPSLIDSNNFKNLEAIISKNITNTIAEEKHFSFKNGLFPGFVGTDGLSLRYLLVQDLLLIFSIGEYQPARYIFYFEGAWKVE